MAQPQAQREFWERAALEALAVMLATERESLVDEAAEMAANCADKLLGLWTERFGEKKGSA
jgi:hypothetical protein